MSMAGRVMGLMTHRGGVATVELAIVLPVFLTLVLGGIEIGHMLYVKTVLRGEIEQAARASSLETGPTKISNIDTHVKGIVERITPGAVVSFERRAYRNYDNVINRAEPFSDANGDKLCNHGESYTDVNGNGSWDIDSGVSGIGNARQIVAYDIEVNFPPLFPFMAHVLSKSAFSMKASTQLRNQPYAAGMQPETRTCP